MNLKSKKSAVLAPLLLTAALLLGGCGSSSSDLSAPSDQSTAASTVDIRLAQDGVPSGVTEARLIGMDAAGQKLWDVTFPMSDTLKLPPLPERTDEVVVQYLANRRTVALSLVPLSGDAVRSQTVGASDVLSLSQALTGATLNNTDVEIPNKTIVLLKVAGTLPNGKTLDVTREAVWISTNPQVATVENGLVRGRAEGETTITARVGGITLSTPLSVTAAPSNPPSLQLGSDQNPRHTIDLNNGTLDGRPLPGWNAKNRCLVLTDMDVRCEPSAVTVVGEDWVASCTDSVDVEGEIIPSSPQPTTDCYFYGVQQAGVGFDGFELDGYYDYNPNNPNVPQRTLGWSGGDLTLLSDRTISNSEIQSIGSGVGGRGGDIKIDCEGDLYCVDILAYGGQFAGVPGDIVLRGNTVNLFVNGGPGNQEGGLYASGYFSGHEGPGSPGGRITILAQQGITMAAGCPLDVSGGSGPTTGQDYPGGPGGEVTVITRSGNIVSGSDIRAQGGQAHAQKSGGNGGTVRAFSPQPFAFTGVNASGGDSAEGLGGAGGRVVFTTAGTSIDVSGGQGDPGGAAGTADVLGTDVEVASGSHQFDMRTGLFDNDYILPGWDPTSSTLFVSSFSIEQGGTLSITGRGLFRCVSQGVAQLLGTLSFPGVSAGSPDTPTLGGAMYLSSDTSWVVAGTGAIESKGGDSDSSAAGGGLVQVAAPSLDISGRILTPGGRSSNDLSGRGGDVILNSAGSVTVSGVVDCSGQTGFNDSGAGGSIAVIAAGDLTATGSLLCAGGEAAITGGDGGRVVLRVGGEVSLMEVNLNGADSGLAPGQGGTFNLEALGDIVLAGALTASSGESNQDRPGVGGAITIDGEGTLMVASTGAVNADGNRRGQGGSIVLNSTLGVVTDGPVTATPDGTVTITP